jgi:cytochrome P450
MADQEKMTSRAQSACPVPADFDPLSPKFLADPFAVLDSLPPETPMFYAPSIDYYVVTRYADIKAVFLDPQTYSAAPAQLLLTQFVPEAAQILLGGGHKPQPSMVSLDPPAHTRLRRSISFPRSLSFCRRSRSLVLQASPSATGCKSRHLPGDAPRGKNRCANASNMAA